MGTKLINGHEITEEQCVIENENLVWHSIKDVVYRGQFLGVDKEDLFQEGMIGLIKAYRAYKPGKGASFSTLAVPYIWGTANRHLRDKGRVVRIPRRIMDILAKTYKDSEDGMEVSEIAKKHNIAEEEIKDALLGRHPAESISSNIVHNMDPDNENFSIENWLRTDDDTSSLDVDEFIECLDDREQNIIRLTLGGANQSIIGNMIGVRQPQVSRVLKNIAKKYIKYEERNSLAAV
ncbi:sigma-70 family RNA polymerase sigma factor [Oceanobacillus oncorhynchi]|uniref:sigma-70 family RNA polymerase sigma factor n=1 Tax=Oceanobacillus oncorhynchi TaxID=545501 RepID=UPI0034D556A1